MFLGFFVVIFVFILGPEMLFFSMWLFSYGVHFAFKRWAYRQFKCFDLIIIISDVRMRDQPQFALTVPENAAQCDQQPMTSDDCTTVGLWQQKQRRIGLKGIADINRKTIAYLTHDRH